MSDSRRSRRVGDETRQRIDELADGWDVSSDENSSAAAPEGAAAADPEGRAKPTKTPVLPPPTRARRESRPPPPPRGKRESRPPPPPRGKRESQPPPPPRAKPESHPPPSSERRSTKTLPKTPPKTLPKTNTVGGRHKEPPPPTGLVATAVRAPASLPRKRGLYGDLLYVKSVIFGVTGDRRELVAVAKRLATLSERTRQTTIDLGRRALADSDYSDPDGAREEYVAFEEERSKKAGAVAATEEEIADEKRKLSTGEDATGERISELETELKALEKELAPIEKDLAKARRRAADLKGTITSLDQQISEAKARHPAADDEDESEANLAALRADRDTLIDEEPEVAAELERLGPFRDDLAARIAAHKEEIASLRQGRADSSERSGEVVAALEARLTVERRALSDIDEQREKMFEAVGRAMLERRHVGYIDLYSLVDDHADEMKSLARREKELEERLAVIDRAKLARGILLLLALLGIAGLVTGLVLLSK